MKSLARRFDIMDNDRNKLVSYEEFCGPRDCCTGFGVHKGGHEVKTGVLDVKDLYQLGLCTSPRQI